MNNFYTSSPDRYFTGIGSRSTPISVVNAMSDISMELYFHGYILRSGGANGADTAFEAGVIEALNRLHVPPSETQHFLNIDTEIFLPWKGFNGNSSKLFQISDDALSLASTIHPVWNSLKEPVKRLHARNCYQVLGADLQTPSEFLICWTQDGAMSKYTVDSNTGGTGTAIVLASNNNIPVFNLSNLTCVEDLISFLEFKQVGIPPSLIALSEPKILHTATKVPKP